MIVTPIYREGVIIALICNGKLIDLRIYRACNELAKIMVSAFGILVEDIEKLTKSIREFEQAWTEKN